MSEDTPKYIETFTDKQIDRLEHIGGLVQRALLAADNRDSAEVYRLKVVAETVMFTLFQEIEEKASGIIPGSKRKMTN